MSGPPWTPRGSLARAFSLDSFARPLRSVHDFIDDFPLGSRPRNSGQPGSTCGESCKPGGERRVPHLRSPPRAAPPRPARLLAASLPVHGHPLPGQTEPPALPDCWRCRAVGVPCPWSARAAVPPGEALRCARPAPRRRPRAGPPRGRASAAVPGRREPELRRSATPLPGRPVHLAGEGGRCQWRRKEKPPEWQRRSRKTQASKSVKSPGTSCPTPQDLLPPVRGRPPGACYGEGASPLLGGTVGAEPRVSAPRGTKPRVGPCVCSGVLGWALGFAPHCCLRAQRVGNRQPYVIRALSPCLLPSSCPPNAECRSAEIHSVPGVHYIKKN